MFANNFDGTDPESYMANWECKQAPRPETQWQGNNMPRYCSEEYDALVAEMRQMVDDGYDAIKFKVGVEGGMNPRRDRERVRKVREAVGENVRLLIDANNCWDAATAAQFANTIREYDILLFEEPVLADDIPGLARFRQATDIPLATGEHEYTRYGFRKLIEERTLDILQPDVMWVGGLTELLKIAAHAAAYDIPVVPHGSGPYSYQFIAMSQACGYHPSTLVKMFVERTDAEDEIDLLSAAV